MMKTTRAFAGIILLSFVPAGGALAADRTELSFTDLMSGGLVVNEPAENRFFLQQDGAADALHEFSGSILIPEHLMQTNPAKIAPEIIDGKKTQLFPGAELRFVSHGEHLVPLERDLIILPDSESFWQLQVSPGRVWSEQNDQGMSRASFPFVLTSIIENETYNGVATFLYDDDSSFFPALPGCTAAVAVHDSDPLRCSGPDENKLPAGVVGRADTAGL